MRPHSQVDCGRRRHQALLGRDMGRALRRPQHKRERGRAVETVASGGHGRPRAGRVPGVAAAGHGGRRREGGRAVAGTRAAARCIAVVGAAGRGEMASATESAPPARALIDRRPLPERTPRALGRDLLPHAAAEQRQLQLASRLASRTAAHEQRWWASNSGQSSTCKQTEGETRQTAQQTREAYLTGRTALELAQLSNIHNRSSPRDRTNTLDVDLPCEAQRQQRELMMSRRDQWRARRSRRARGRPRGAWR